MTKVPLKEHLVHNEHARPVNFDVMSDDVETIGPRSEQTADQEIIRADHDGGPLS